MSEPAGWKTTASLEVVGRLVRDAEGTKAKGCPRPWDFDKSKSESGREWIHVYV